VAKATKKKRTAPKKVQSNKKKKQAPIKKRERAVYPGLEKRLFSRIKQEYHDYDYVDKLSDKDKKWLSDFTSEWLGANLNDSDKKMHKSNKRRKQVFDMNNARNRDLLSNVKAGGLVDDVYSLEERSTIDPSKAEDAIIDSIEVDQEMLDAMEEVLKDKCKG
jgi:truncated hemoglobin YjbI